MRPDTPAPGVLRQRFRPLLWFGVLFVGVAFLVRLILLVKTRHEVPPNLGQWLYLFLVGFGYDLVTYIYFAWPLLLVLWLLPRRAYLSRWGHRGMIGLCFVLAFAVLYPGAAELVFWGEFSARFNFIAVDYLVYTHEVVGNIRESYPIGTWSVLLLLGTLAVMFFSRRTLAARDDGSRFLGRTAVVGVWLVLTVAVSFAVDGSMKDRSSNNYVNELAGNGIYQFFAAFRDNELDYAKYYPTLPKDEAFSNLRGLLKTPEATFTSDDPMDITRTITASGPEKKLNIVLISVESLSGDYVEGLDVSKHKHLMPNLDALASKSLFFTQLYANGTRTVRGLEALSLSVPPTPGESIVKRPGNEGLWSLADVFNAKGYESEFLYGGYGYFDNMNHFFASNGYTAVDRNEIADKDIHAENVWGVADEDLFHPRDEAHGRLLREGQAVLRPCHDDVEPSPVHFPRRSRPVAAGLASRGGAVHRLGDRRFPEACRDQAVVRRHDLRDHGGPLRDERRQDEPARRPVSHPAVHLFPEACAAGPRGSPDEPDRHSADDPGHAQFQLHLALLWLRPVQAGAGPRARLPQHVPGAGLSAWRRAEFADPAPAGEGDGAAEDDG